jgi:uncharacterized protein YdeI (YjbR/CyaY-like superfamily)
MALAQLRAQPGANMIGKWKIVRLKPMPDAYYAGLTEWAPECLRLREVLLSCGLEETLKWKQPCYTDNGKNIVLVSTMNQAATLNFMKGVHIDDVHGLLIKPGEHTQTGRQMRFTSVEAIDASIDILRSYVAQAVEAERGGQRVAPAADPESIVVAQALEGDDLLREAWEGLTPGRRRGYLLHITSSKNPETQQQRLERHKERIVAGKGMHDCICGRSARMPRCDGSHKHG